MSKFKLRRLAVAAATVIGIAVFVVVNPSNYKPETNGPPASTGSGQNSALSVLEKLPVKGRAPKTGYSRDQFGNGWGEINGCDTRNVILERDLTGTVLNDCLVMSGTLNDPYTGGAISFKRGAGTSSAVQIDHVVALSDAWQKGAQQLSAAMRKQLANDPLELLAVDGKTNQSKGDGDAATWLPPNKAFRCEYAARQVAVKYKYSLWVTEAEHDALSKILSNCPDQKMME
jgi:hypothetical protein